MTEFTPNAIAIGGSDAKYDRTGCTVYENHLTPRRPGPERRTEHQPSEETITDKAPAESVADEISALPFTAIIGHWNRARAEGAV